MRILLTTDTLGGVWTFTQELVQGLLSLGHAVTLVSLGRAPSIVQVEWCGEMRLRYRHLFRYDALNVPLEWMTCNDAAYSAAGADLLRIAQEVKAEVLHSSQFCFGALPVSIPRVVTAHSDVLSWAEVCRPEGLEASAWLSRYVSLVEDGLAGCTAVVAPTNWMAAALQRGFPQVSTKGMRVILNGRSLPQPVASDNNRLLQAVSAGRRWDEAKGFASLVGLDAAMPVVLAGENPLNDLDGYGVLGEKQIQALFTASSVYVAASVYEPFGLAPLEAALCGCAVVANDIPSLREVWGQAASFYRNQKELKQILDHFITFRNQLRCAQLASRTRALELSATAMVQAYLALYTELAAQGESPFSRLRMAYAS